ncbi:hypothetical protein ID866_8615 [Astraeus odoratus]|nr:hypothetical protein ID866_8615 [Astraeus odoratus]
MTSTGMGLEYQALPTSDDADHTLSELNEEDRPMSGDPPSNAPVDARIGWTYFLLGCAVLLPWNAVINATSFFISRLVGNPMRATFSSYQSSVFTVTGLVFQAYCTVTSKQSSPSRRVFWSTATIAFFIFLLFLSTLVRVDPSTFFISVLFSSFCMSAAGAYQATAVYAGAALLGGSCMQATLSGQAAVGVVVSIVELIGTAISVWGTSPEVIAAFVADGTVGDGQAEELAARIFFGLSVLFMALTFVAYVWLTKQPLYQLTVGHLEPNDKESCGANDGEECSELASSGLGLPQADSLLDVLRVFRSNFSFMFSATYVYVITLAIFPTITVTVSPTSPSIHPLLFVSAHFLVFNVGDLLGRLICSFPHAVIWSDRGILAMSLLRTLFIPIVLLCNVRRPATYPVPPFISSDILYMFILLAIGVSNGYVTTLCFIAVSSPVRNHRLRGYEDVDIAAALVGFVIVVGLAIGALLSFGVRSTICECNPFNS